MASIASHARPTSLTSAIDYYFDLSLYLLVMVGFETLASTGGVDLPAILLVGVALAYRGYLLMKRRTVVISERWTTPLSFAYFVFFAVDYFVFSRGFLPATVHLALFGVVVRMFSLRRERDYVMLAILAFLMVLAAAVLTVDSVFLFSFAGFLLMAVITFVLMEMRSSNRNAEVRARRSGDLQEQRRLAFSLARFAPMIMVMILGGATVVFFLLPRMSTGYLGGYSFGSDIGTGFSDHVQLGQIGQIQQSNAVVMHIQIDGDATGRYDLRWRGIALADFDGHTWSSSREQYILPRRSDNTFAVPAFGTASAPAYAAEAQADQKFVAQKFIHYRVLMEPIGTNVFFLAPWARSVSGAYRLLSADSGGAVYDVDNTRAISRYEAESNIAIPLPDSLRTAGEHYPAGLSAKYLRLPAMDARIAELARKITSSASTPFDKAVAAESYLRTHFGYTLQLPRTVAKDPLANFLFERKQGHCEYFASSMAVMLRTLGIPSRVVNGFRSDEFNDLTGNYVVRAKNAHSWVEAYFPGYGWQSFDPTPAGTSGTPQGWERALLYLDAMSSFWRDWIVSYDTSHQFVLGQAALTGTRGAWEGARDWARERYASLLDWARQSQSDMEDSPWLWGSVALAAVLLLTALLNGRRMLMWIREKRLLLHPERAPELAATMWYQRMARSMARRGQPRVGAETPQEWMKKIPDESLRAPVERFTRAYESARFGNSTDDAQRLPELFEEVRTAARK